MYVFFFKQKTAYEMRISDWSPDVCSSDLRHPAGFTAHQQAGFDHAHVAQVQALAGAVVRGVVGARDRVLSVCEGVEEGLADDGADREVERLVRLVACVGALGHPYRAQLVRVVAEQRGVEVERSEERLEGKGC